jgi:EmrB/QacA subfamily drug resistance transporter
MAPVTTQSPPTPPRTAAQPDAAALVLVAIVGCEFMLQLDTTIVAVALPSVQTDLGVSAASLSWVINGFTLAFGGLLLLGGRLGDVLGHRTVFLVGTGLFAAASALAGLAPGFGWLLVGRVLQGGGAALAGPAGLALLRLNFTGDRQPRAFAVYSTVTGLGASAGLIIGGVLTWTAGWRWTMLVNVPIGVAAILVAVRVLRLRLRLRSERHGLDLLGALTSVAGMTAVLLGLVRAADQGWSNVVAVASLAAGLVLLGCFVAIEAKTGSPMLPLRIVADRERSIALIATSLMAFVLTGFLFFSTQFLQHVLRLNPALTGLAYLPFGVTLLIAARGVPRLISRVRPHTLVLVGFGLMLAGTGWLSALHASSAYWTGVLGPMVLLGVGAGIIVVPLNIIVLSSAAPRDAGVTSAVLQATLSVGGSLGVAVLLTVYSHTTGGIAPAVSHTFAGSSIVAAAGLAVACIGRLNAKRAVR